MFKRLHITVDRDSPQNRVRTLARAIVALKEGRSVAIFPEGGMRTKNPPQMFQPLTEGAFKMAIKQQVPIVPITLLNCYKIVPENTENKGVYRQKLKAVVHAPIMTEGKTDADIPALKEAFYNLVNGTLMQHHGLTGEPFGG